MIALYIYVAFSYLFMASYCLTGWAITKSTVNNSAMGFIFIFAFAPLTVPIIMGMDSFCSNKPN